MRPAFLILADGADVTAAIADRLLRLTVSDQEGIDADEVSILVDDRDHRVALPRRGARLAVNIGYAETGLSPMGIFTVDEVTLEGPPFEVGILGRSADLRDSFKEQKSRHYEDTTLGAVMERIAADHGLAAAVDPQLAGRRIDYFLQTAESDLHFAKRLARRHDALVKPAGGRLVVVRRDAGVGGGGAALPAVTLAPAQTSHVRTSLKDRPKHGSVEAAWHDRDDSRLKWVREGAAEPRMRLPHAYPDEEEATRAARARKRELDRAERSLSVEMPGLPAIAAEITVTMSGFRDGIDGAWTVQRAEHTIDAGGYRTSFEAEGREDT